VLPYPADTHLLFLALIRNLFLVVVYVIVEFSDLACNQHSNHNVYVYIHQCTEHSCEPVDTDQNCNTVHRQSKRGRKEGINHHRLKPVKAKEQFSVGTWTILPFDVEHDVAEPLGFLLMNEQGENLLFATDTYYVRYKFKDLTHIMIECNYSLDILNENIESEIIHPAMKRRLMTSHFSLENVIEFLKVNDLSKVQEIHLIHLSETNSNEIEFKRKVQEVTGKPVYVS